MLPPSHINAFQKLWKTRTGEDISFDRALEEGMKTIQLVKVLTGNASRKQY
jgi:hypothetical protein